MIIKTRGIVFQNIKYSESSLILKIYTQKSGLMSFLFKGGRKKKHKTFYGHLAEVDIIAKVNENRNLHYVKEITNVSLYKTININIVKSSVLMFCNEIIINTVKEEEQNQQLYDFISNSIKYLDENNDIENFVLNFLINLSRYLGFYPSNKFAIDAKYFDLEEGVFCNNKPIHDNVIKEDLVKCFVEMLSINDNKNVNFTSSQRIGVLEGLIEYYNLHVPGFKRVKSLPIIREVLY